MTSAKNETMKKLDKGEFNILGDTGIDEAGGHEGVRGQEHALTNMGRIEIQGIGISFQKLLVKDMKQCIFGVNLA